MKQFLFRLNLDELGGDTWTFVFDDKITKMTTREVAEDIKPIMAIKASDCPADAIFGNVKIIGIDQGQLVRIQDYLSMFVEVPRVKELMEKS